MRTARQRAANPRRGLYRPECAPAAWPGPLSPSNTSRTMTTHEPDLSQVLDYRGKHKAPYYATEQAAGLDLTADIEAEFALEPGEVVPVPTGLWVRLPDGVEMQIRPRSGLGLHHTIGVINSPGTIDPDFKDEVLVLLINHGKRPYKIKPGERIAQAVLAPFYRTQQGMTNDTKTRVGGTGSTGK